MMLSNVSVTNRQNEITKLKVKEVALKEELNQLKANLETPISFNVGE